MSRILTICGSLDRIISNMLPALSEHGLFSLVGSRTNCVRPRLLKKSSKILCTPSDFAKLFDQSIDGKLKSPRINEVTFVTDRLYNKSRRAILLLLELDQVCLGSIS